MRGYGDKFVHAYVGCNCWGKFDSLDERLYVGPHVDLRVLQGVTITGGELVVLKASLTFNSRVINNTQAFLERWKRVQLHLQGTFVVLRQGGR